MDFPKIDLKDESNKKVMVAAVTDFGAKFKKMYDQFDLCHLADVSALMEKLKMDKRVEDVFKNYIKDRSEDECDGWADDRVSTEELDTNKTEKDSEEAARTGSKLDLEVDGNEYKLISCVKEFGESYKALNRLISKYDDHFDHYSINLQVHPNVQNILYKMQRETYTPWVSVKHNYKGKNDTTAGDLNQTEDFEKIDSEDVSENTATEVEEERKEGDYPMPAEDAKFLYEQGDYVWKMKLDSLAKLRGDKRTAAMAGLIDEMAAFDETVKMMKKEGKLVEKEANKN